MFCIRKGPSSHPEALSPGSGVGRLIGLSGVGTSHAGTEPRSHAANKGRDRARAHLLPLSSALLPLAEPTVPVRPQ